MSSQKQQQDNDIFAPMVLRKNIPEKQVQPRKVVVNAGGNVIKKVYDKEDPNAEPELVRVQITPEFGQKIVNARVQKGLTQKQLAVTLAIPERVINEYEKGLGAKNQAYVNKLKKFLAI
jgi:ribosome-binding protein aMBF1 (putative translation factor)